MKQAQHYGYRSRAAFKLLQIQTKLHLFKPGMLVVDLGAAPGSWSEVAAAKVGKHGRVLAVDILPMEQIENVEFIQGDFSDTVIYQHLLDLIQQQPVDVVLSDMAPNLSGISAIDQPRIFYLAELALEFASQVLSPEGVFLIKVFQGVGFEQYLRTLRQKFKRISIEKPEASRKRSNEIYLLAKHLQV